MAAKKQINAFPTSLLVVVGALIAIAYFYAFHPSEGRKSCIASCTGFVTGLELETKYYYKCGDSCLGAMSEELVFETLPLPGSGNYPTRIAFVGDLDLTSNSTTTVDHFILLLLGDLTYANQYLTTGGRGASCYPCEFPDSTRDTYQPRWDGWGRPTSRLNQSSIWKHSVINLSSILYIISIKLHIQLRSCTRFMLPLTSSVPMMVIEGNHKVSRLGVEPYDIEEADQKCKRMVCRGLFRVFEGPDYCSIVSRLLKEDTELFGNKYVSISELGTVYSDGIVIFSVTTSRDQKQQRDGDELEESDGGEKEVDDRRQQQQRDGDEIEESDEGEKDVDDRRQQQQRDGDELEESDGGEQEVDDRRQQQQRDGDEIEESDEGEKDVDDRRQQQQRDGDELEESDGGEQEVDDRRQQQQRDGDEIDQESDEGEKDVDDRRQQQQRDGDEIDQESDEGEKDVDDRRQQQQRDGDEIDQESDEGEKDVDDRRQQQQRDGDEIDQESDEGEKDVDDRRQQQQRDGDEIDQESDEGEKDVDDRRQQQQRDGDEIDQESDEGEDRRQPWHARLMELLPRGRTEENQMSLEEQLQRHLAETHRRVGAEEEQRRRVPWYICLLAILPCVEADSMVPHRDQREWVSRGRRFLVVVGVLAFFVLMCIYQKTQGSF